MSEETSRAMQAQLPLDNTRPIPVGIVGATGYVGQRFVTLLADHPWFKIKRIAASKRSAGKCYSEAVEGRWEIDQACPETIQSLTLHDLDDLEGFCEGIDMVFCAVDMPKDELVALEERLARQEVIVVSNNSANRKTIDVPMVIPEINGQHFAIVEQQKQRLGTTRGFIACKPNCSIQSFVPALSALRLFEPEQVMVSTYQAISGAGKTFETWPEMIGNVIPYIGGEEQKSEEEPLKIWGELTDEGIKIASNPVISAQCYRVAVQEGHTASVSVKFKSKPTREQILEAWSQNDYDPQRWKLPSAPEPFIRYHEEENRPQPQCDATIDEGMTIHVGRLREDPVMDWKFTCLSHNTLRGAAGGAVLMAEYIVALGLLEP